MSSPIQAHTLVRIIRQPLSVPVPLEGEIGFVVSVDDEKGAAKLYTLDTKGNEKGCYTVWLSCLQQLPETTPNYKNLLRYGEDILAFQNLPPEGQERELMLAIRLLNLQERFPNLQDALRNEDLDPLDRVVLRAWTLGKYETYPSKEERVARACERLAQIGMDGLNRERLVTLISVLHEERLI